MADVEAATPAIGDPPTSPVTLPVGRKKRGRHRVRWRRVSLLVGAGVTGFFAAYLLLADYVSELCAGFIGRMPYVAGERQIPYDVPGMLAGVDIADGWYGYEPTKYTLYLPPNRAAAEPLPLLVCLHGNGDEAGKYVTQGLAPAIREKVKNGGDYPIAALFPTARQGQWSPGSKGANDALRLIDLVIARHGIDPRRVYLTGWSSGGNGVWSLAEAYPERWAAVVPLCAAPPYGPERIRSMPVWAFVGDIDSQTPLGDVESFVRRHRDNGADARLTVYHNVSHNVWDKAYRETGLYEWLGRYERAGGRGAGR